MATTGMWLWDLTCPELYLAKPGTSDIHSNADGSHDECHT
jgi:hypothetical protein